MSDLTGQSLGPYTITERIGRGGMAEVYKAFHTGLSVHRAIKVIRPEFVDADDFRARFQHEAQAVAALRHPNIVQVHDFGTHDNAYYMVMEFIEGRDLKRILTAEGPIRPVPRAVKLIDRIASALEYAHSHDIIHRDIKPENVMVTAAGEPILTDFGIAKLASAGTRLTQTGVGIGTPAYMSPEQARGAEIGPPADIYALTIVLFEVLTGRVPFSADTPIAVILKAINDPLPLPRRLTTDVSEALQAVILKGAQKRPADRYATVTEFRRDLAAAVHDAGVGHTTIVAPARAGRARGRPGSRRAAWLAGSLGVLGIAALASWYLSNDEGLLGEAGREDEPPQQPVATAPASAAVGTLEFDVPTGTRAPGDQWTFTGTAGDTLFLDRIDAAPARFVLIAPNGVRLLDSEGDAGPFELPQTGSYRLTSETKTDDAPTFVLRRLAVPVLDGGEITLDAMVEGETVLPGQSIRYRVKLPAGESVRLVLDRSTAPVDVRLTDARGTRTLLAADQTTSIAAAPAGGEYQLTVDPRADGVAQFAFALRSSPPRPAPAETPATSPPVAAPTPARVTDEPTVTSTTIPAGTSAPTPTDRVTRGVTTQRDLLRLFGGPNLTTVDRAGLETWVYERTFTQTDATSSSQRAGGSVDFGVFFDVDRGAVGAASERTGASASTRSSSTIRSLTVIVSFAPDRTVADYTVRETFF